MSGYKILFKITGSIAAYKSAYVVSKLVQNNYEVKVAATESALKFVGKATFEGLTGNPVYTDQFEQGEMMNHISLIKWADLVVVCPASANTINKMAAGIADNLVTSLFLAFDWTKPYLVAPAMNTKMFDHPATQNSLKKLEDWGVKILYPAEGHLACGDVGKGKLLEPDEIYDRIVNEFVKHKSSKRHLKILITSGGTKERIDGIRFISNLSTGKTGAYLAEYFAKYNHEVTFLYASDSFIPLVDCEKISYLDFAGLNEKLQTILAEKDFDAVIHLAAVGDYSVESIEIDDKKIPLPITGKIDSDSDNLKLNLRRNKKLINELRNYSKNKKITIVGFKLTDTSDIKQRNFLVQKLINESGSNFVVLNDRNDRVDGNVQKNFYVFDKKEKISECSEIKCLSEVLEDLLTKK